MENPNNLAYALIGLLFTFTTILTGYLAVDIVGGISFDTINADPSKFIGLKEKIETARLVSFAGTLFSVIGFVVVYIYTWAVDFKSKVFFYAGIVWSVIHIVLSAGMAIFVLPVAITLLIHKDRHFNPEKYEKPRVTAAERMSNMQAKNENQQNESKT